jgi:hypothetical protein
VRKTLNINPIQNQNSAFSLQFLHSGLRRQKIDGLEISNTYSIMKSEIHIISTLMAPI